MVYQSINLTQTKWKIPNVVHAVQGDTGRMLVMIVSDESIPSGASGMLSMQRPDGTEFDIAATLNATDNAFQADMTQGLTQPGIVKAQLIITTGGVNISSYLFTIDVQSRVSGEITREEYSSVADAIAAANRANTASDLALVAREQAEAGAQTATNAASAATEAAEKAQEAAEKALTYSGGYVYLTDQRDTTQYSVGLMVTEDGYPALLLTERT